MAKLTPSRLRGVYGMRKFTADQLFAHAEKLEAQIKDPANTDDPKWLQQWADKIRWLARQKETAKAHKDGTRRRLTNR
jgi:hypothetical protein